MDGLRRLWCLVIVGWLVLSSPGQLLGDRRNQLRASLFAQSAAQILDREFPGCRPGIRADGSCAQSLSFLVLDARTGVILASQWPHPEEPIPLGSLTKPFTALAYGEQHGFTYPQHICRGTSTGCWLPRGHGHVDLSAAIAHSCNSYFRMLTADMKAEDMLAVATSFGLEPPSADATGAGLAGVGTRWSISPIKMANAYLELIRRREGPGVRQLIAGMAQSGNEGTGAGVDRTLRHTHALVKTGTAPCTHSKRAPGDGFAIALVPAEEPEILLMVRLHGAPGAQAARAAGQMLARLGE
jgi:hypothetical protein